MRSNFELLRSPNGSPSGSGVDKSSSSLISSFRQAIEVGRAQNPTRCEDSCPLKSFHNCHPIVRRRLIEACRGSSKISFGCSHRSNIYFTSMIDSLRRSCKPRLAPNHGYEGVYSQPSPPNAHTYQTSLRRLLELRIIHSYGCR